MSMKTFTNVTLEDIENVLRADKGWSVVVEPGTREIVFEFPLTTSPHIVIRVCSGIMPISNNSRGCGKDAIRIFAINKHTGKGWISTKRINRIGTWEKNLRKAITNCFNEAKNRRDR